MPTLIIQLPGLPPVEHLVREDAITLGRMQGNSLALNDASVSLSHAKITRVGNSFYIKDLNSTNGTTLNGQSIAEARLRDGDQLELGKVTACFRLEPLASPALLLPVKPMEPTLLPPLPPSRTRWQGRRWRVLAGLAGLTLLGLWIVKEVPIDYSKEINQKVENEVWKIRSELSKQQTDLRETVIQLKVRFP